MGESLKRIKQFIDSQGINISTFEKSVGLSNGSFATQLKNDKSIGVDKLENILRIYPDLNPDWVLRGEGNMTRNIVRSSVNEPAQQYDKRERAHQDLHAWRPEAFDIHTFTKLEEIEIKMISHSLVDLLIHGGKQDIETQKAYIVKVNRDYAYEYYLQSQADPRLQ